MKWFHPQVLQLEVKAIWASVWNVPVGSWNWHAGEYSNTGVRWPSTALPHLKPSYLIQPSLESSPSINSSEAPPLELCQSGLQSLGLFNLLGTGYPNLLIKCDTKQAFPSCLWGSVDCLCFPICKLKKLNKRPRRSLPARPESKISNLPLPLTTWVAWASYLSHHSLAKSLVTSSSEVVVNIRAYTEHARSDANSVTPTEGWRLSPRPLNMV